MTRATLSLAPGPPPHLLLAASLGALGSTGVVAQRSSKAQSHPRVTAIHGYHSYLLLRRTLRKPCLTQQWLRTEKEVVDNPAETPAQCCTSPYKHTHNQGPPGGMEVPCKAHPSLVPGTRAMSSLPHHSHHHSGLEKHIHQEQDPLTPLSLTQAHLIVVLQLYCVPLAITDSPRDEWRHSGG